MVDYASARPAAGRSALTPWLVEFKLHCYERGIEITEAAQLSLAGPATRPLTLHEYATTGGVTLRLGDVFINAPFDDWYCSESEALLDVRPDGTFFARFRGVECDCEVLPLPGYLDAVNEFGTPVITTTMSHADRVRVSPLAGCVLDCAFCDMPSLRYRRHLPEDVLASLKVALADDVLPTSHLLISGGSPGPRHLSWWDDCVETIIAGAGVSTDLMMSPRIGDLGFVSRFVDAGVAGFSFNLEIAGAEVARSLMPRKHAESTPYFETTVAEAVRLLGAGDGAVRSIVIVGLERPDITVAAVEQIARMGADPVLSPFRPAQKTALEKLRPPTAALLKEVWERSSEVAERHGVALGPRCIPCQHNTLTFPEGDAYHYGAEAGGAG